MLQTTYGLRGENCAMNASLTTSASYSSSRLACEWIKTWEELLPLRDEWNSLLNQSVHRSIFLTFEWLTTAWQHFHRHDSELFVLTLRDDDQRLIGIGPFRRSLRREGRSNFETSTSFPPGRSTSRT